MDGGGLSNLIIHKVGLKPKTFRSLGLNDCFRLMRRCRIALLDREELEDPDVKDAAPAIAVFVDVEVLWVGHVPVEVIQNVDMVSPPLSAAAWGGWGTLAATPGHTVWGGEGS